MKFKTCFLGLVMLWFTAAVWATSSPEDKTDTPKIRWLEEVKMAVPVPVCKSFVEDDAIGTQMKEKHISYDQCVSLIPEVTNKCIKKYDAAMPAMISDESADKWGKAIGECIGNEFAMTYLYAEAITKPIVSGR